MFTNYKKTSLEYAQKYINECKACRAVANLLNKAQS